MPIRMFETYGHEDILEKRTLNTLENSIVAIDGSWYIRKYLSMSNEEEFLSAPLALETLVKNLVELSKKASILWIWDGIEFRQPVTPGLDKLCWDISNKIIFSRFNKRIYDQEIYITKMTEKLRANGIAVMRAPYSAAAQCAYFMKHCKTHIFSRNDALLFTDCTRVIVDFDYENSTIDVIDRDVLFEKCNLNLESFRRLAFLSGCEYCSTYPLFANDFDPIKVIELLKKNTGADPILKDYEISHDSKYFTEYQQGFTILENPVVMGFNGVIQIADQKASTDTLKEIFGRRLAGKVYQEIFACNIGTKFLSNVIFNRIKPYLVRRLVDFLETVLEAPKNNAEIPKASTLSELFVKKYDLQITWSPSINKAVQVLFHIFLAGDFKPEFLIKFLNSGCMTGQPWVAEDLTPSERLLRFSTKYSPANLEHFCMFLENHMLLTEIADLIKCNSNIQNNIEFDFTLADFTAKLEKPLLKEFLMQNISDSARLNEFLEVLEAQN